MFYCSYNFAGMCAYHRAARVMTFGSTFFMVFLHTFVKIFVTNCKPLIAKILLVCWSVAFFYHDVCVLPTNRSQFKAVFSELYTQVGNGLGKNWLHS